MNQDNNDTIPFSEWYEENKYSFPDHLEESFSDNLEYMFFLQNVYRKAMVKIEPALYKLMLEQYPVFAAETRPKVLDYLKSIPTNAGWHFIFKMYEVVQDHDVNLPVQFKYPEFERWKEFYMRVRKPEKIDEKTRDQYEWLDDQEWIEYRNAENKALLEYFNWYEKRFLDFTKILETLLLEYYPQVNLLNEDEQVLLVVHLTDEYENYKTECERIELFIDCGFPEEDISLSYEEFDKKYSQLSSEQKEEVRSLRNRRICGEKI